MEYIVSNKLFKKPSEFIIAMFIEVKICYCSIAVFMICLLKGFFWGRKFMKIKTISEDDIKILPKTKQIIIFGAGDFGIKVILPLLKAYGHKISAIWDNDKNKQGNIVDDIKIISYEDLKQYKDFILVVGSNYIYQEMERIDALNCSEIIQIALAEDIINVDEEHIQNAIKAVTKMKELFNDEKSIESIDCFLDYLKNRDVSVFHKISTNEKHYLVKEVLDTLLPSDVLVDLGAFIGEFPIDLAKSSIPFKKCYCFEISEKNCKRLYSNIGPLGLKDKVECIQKAASDNCGELYINDDGANTKICKEKTGHKVETITLDKFFKETKISYIKTDIEGAEMEALKGATKVLKRDRPILAISIYHSLSDYQNIPVFLNNILENYKFFIRNHSIYCAEIVLYAIPNERFNKQI